MAKPLTKKTKDGVTYTRPDDVEANIDGAINQPLEVIRQRLQFTSRTQLDYLKSECIVHLFRDALERKDEERLSALHTLLMKRVEGLLRYKIPDGDLPDAIELRSEAMYKLNVLLATADASLDFYEIRFNQAFANLYLPILRPARRKAEERPPHVPFEESEHSNRSVFETPEEAAVKSDLLATIRTLPRDEQLAFLLVERIGYDVESNDPVKRTAATICGVSGRAIRNRLARAKKKLAQFMKDVNA